MIAKEDHEPGKDKEVEPCHTIKMNVIPFWTT